MGGGGGSVYVWVWVYGWKGKEMLLSLRQARNLEDNSDRIYIYIHNLGLSMKTMIIHGVPTGTISCTLPGKKGDSQIWKIRLESHYRAFQPCRDMSKPSRTARS